MKRFVSFILTVVFVCGLVPAWANAGTTGESKEGYTLVPTAYGGSGVNPSSSFLLTTPEAAALPQVQEGLSIDGQPAPTVLQQSENEFLIQPVSELLSNTLYLFRLSREGQEEITWAFQTTKKFQLTSSFPSNQATNVPVNSGVELTFSSGGYSRIDEYFDISPAVEGRFERHKNTAVFVPSALDYGTVYTVTVKAGLRLEETGETLGEDYTVSFETEMDSKILEEYEYAKFSFAERYTELPSHDYPRIKFYVYDNEGQKPCPEINVYQFNSAAQAVQAAKTVVQIPHWADWAGETAWPDTSNLPLVLSFQATDGIENENGILSLPDKLSQGFYLLEATLDGKSSKMILQISDLPVQVVADGQKALIWVNDSTMGKPAVGATVYDTLFDKTYNTDAQGLAVIERELDHDASIGQLEITARDGKQCVWIRRQNDNSYRQSDTSAGRNSFWTVMQLDRTLFHSDDTVSFWGFMKPRDDETPPKTVTAVLTEGYRDTYGSSRDILAKQTVPVTNTGYLGEIKLPNIDTGSYCLSIMNGDTVLGASYFLVQDFVKPPYRVEISADKKAVFAGEEVAFTVKAAFFEGTPLPELDISYRLSSYKLKTSGTGTGRLGEDGTLQVKETVQPKPDGQGQTTLSMTAEATLPEIGNTTASGSVRAFINDIDVSAAAKRTGKEASLSVKAQDITLDRLNDGIAEHYGDYLDGPVQGEPVAVEIYRSYWERLESGHYYDYIEKKSFPRYSYQRHEEKIDGFTMTTNQDGVAEKQFAVPDRSEESYYARITCKDHQGREIQLTRYIGRDYSSYSRWNSRYYLDGPEEDCEVGEEVSLTLKRHGETVDNGNFLFVRLQNGIQHYQIGKNPYVFQFSEQDIPNVVVNLYYFDGEKYQSGYGMSRSVWLNKESRTLNLAASLEKDSYRPGELCTVTVEATDREGKPRQADLNVSIVDEALFALRDYNVDTLNMLYLSVDAGLVLASATHASYIRDSEDYNDGAYGGNSGAGGGGAAGEAYVRSEFKDTASFGHIQTDKQGKGTYTFRLPDNITSWRMTLSGVSGDLYAGNLTKPIAVTNPMFINYTLNDTFLTGDSPVLGVSAYGSELTGGGAVQFEVWDAEKPEEKRTASGAAFERVNLPLWRMDAEGAHKLVIKATAENGNSDAVEHPYQILNTYRTVDTAEYYDVTAETVFDAGDGGAAKITFADRGRGQYLCQLVGLRNTSGDRVEKLIAKREANRLIREYFPDLGFYQDGVDFNPQQYQTPDGGMAVLPYADSDLALTAKLMPYVKDEINLNALKDYLYLQYEGENAENKLCALYGLAMLQEPVLNELERYAMLEGLSVQDTVYLALAYCALGETGVAAQLYDLRIVPGLESLTPYDRVNTGEDNDDMLEATSAAFLLAMKLEKPEREGLYQYCVANCTKDILIDVEKLSYIQHEIQQKSDGAGSVTYRLLDETYTREINYGGSYTLRLPAGSMADFQVLDVTGAVGAVLIRQTPMEATVPVDPEVTVRRRYYKANEYETSSTEFQQGDLVRVQVWIDYTAKALDGAYCVTDYLPAGLAYVSGSAKIEDSDGFGFGWRRYAKIEGQKISFYDYNSQFNQGYLYYYYARVVSPGVYRAEGTVVQNLTAKDSISVGENQTFKIY